MEKKKKSDPNVKTFDFVVGWSNEILGGIGGYMDNKKLLFGVAMKRLYEDYVNALNSKNPKDLIRFAEGVIADVNEMEDKHIDVDVRLSAKK